jgi:hypothetical protein
MRVVAGLFRLVRTLCVSRSGLIAENLALRQQLAVLLRHKPRPRLWLRDRLFWVILGPKPPR